MLYPIKVFYVFLVYVIKESMMYYELAISNSKLVFLRTHHPPKPPLPPSLPPVFPRYRHHPVRSPRPR